MVLILKIFFSQAALDFNSTSNVILKGWNAQSYRTRFKQFLILLHSGIWQVYFKSNPLGFVTNFSLVLLHLLKIQSCWTRIFLCFKVLVQLTLGLLQVQTCKTVKTVNAKLEYKRYIKLYRTQLLVYFKTSPLRLFYSFVGQRSYRSVDLV